MDGFYEKGYNLALDNLYTSPELLLHYTSMALMHMKLCVTKKVYLMDFGVGIQQKALRNHQ